MKTWPPIPGQSTSRIRFRPGVYRFRSIEEMKENRMRIMMDGSRRTWKASATLRRLASAR